MVTISNNMDEHSSVAAGQQRRPLHPHQAANQQPDILQHTQQHQQQQQLEHQQDDSQLPPVVTSEMVGREFVRQYYTVLNNAPQFLYRFYSQDSIYVHPTGNLSFTEAPLPEAPLQEEVVGQTSIQRKISELEFSECAVKINNISAHHTLSEGIVVQVCGRLSNSKGPYRKFAQTFVLATQSPRKYYVHNDIFYYLDDIFREASTDDEEVPQERHEMVEQPISNGMHIAPPVATPEQGMVQSVSTYPSTASVTQTNSSGAPSAPMPFAQHEPLPPRASDVSPISSEIAAAQAPPQPTTLFQPMQKRQEGVEELEMGTRVSVGGAGSMSGSSYSEHPFTSPEPQYAGEPVEIRGAEAHDPVFQGADKAGQNQQTVSSSAVTFHERSSSPQLTQPQANTWANVAAAKTSVAYQFPSGAAYPAQVAAAFTPTPTFHVPINHGMLPHMVQIRPQQIHQQYMRSSEPPIGHMDMSNAIQVQQQQQQQMGSGGGGYPMGYGGGGGRPPSGTVQQKFHEVFVSKLQPGVTQEEIASALSEFGHILKVDIRMSKGNPIAFVAFSDPDSVNKAVEARMVQMSNGAQMNVQYRRENLNREFRGGAYRDNYRGMKGVSPAPSMPSGVMTRGGRGRGGRGGSGGRGGGGGGSQMMPSR